MSAQQTLRNAGASVSFLVTVGVSVCCFVLACDVGLHLSSNSALKANPPRVEMVAVGVLSLACGFAVFAVLRWKGQSRGTMARWMVAGVLGMVAAIAGGVFALVAGILLTSSTWGNLAGEDFFERNRLVEAAAQSWIYWLILLVAVLVLVAGLLIWGRPQTEGRHTGLRWIAGFAGIAAAVPAIGALVTTATSGVAP